MKIKYFEDTDTLYIEFSDGDIVEARDLDENTLVEFDAGGRLCAMTMENASQRTDARHLSFEQVAA